MSDLAISNPRFSQLKAGERITGQWGRSKASITAGQTIIVARLDDMKGPDQSDVIRVKVLESVIDAEGVSLVLIKDVTEAPKVVIPEFTVEYDRTKLKNNSLVWSGKIEGALRSAAATAWGHEYKYKNSFIRYITGNTCPKWHFEASMNEANYYKVFVVFKIENHCSTSDDYWYKESKYDFFMVRLYANALWVPKHKLSGANDQLFELSNEGLVGAERRLGSISGLMVKWKDLPENHVTLGYPLSLDFAVTNM